MQVKRTIYALPFFLKSGHGILIDKIDHSFYSKEN